MPVLIRSRFLTTLLLGSLSLLALPLHAQESENTFTIAVGPDLQQEVLKDDDTRLANRFQWLVDNRKKLNLKIFLQTGDFMNWDTPDHDQYERGSKALAILDKADLPYQLAIGNHDTAATKVGGSAAPGNTHDNQRITTTFNRYFPVSRQKYLKGFYEPGKVDNAYQTFTAGGLNWLVINLELWPRAGAVAWAKKVADDHPNHNIILITHSFLTGGGRPSFQRTPAPGTNATTPGNAPAVSAAPPAPPSASEPPRPSGEIGIEQRNGGYGDNSPQYVFDNFLSQCPNVRLVFCGHVGQHGYHTDKGVKGNTIYEFLTTYHSNVDNPVRLVTIDTKQGTIRTRVFCPSTGKDRDDGSTMTVTGIQWVPASANSRAAAPAR